MPKINLDVPTPVSAPEAFTKIKNFLNSDNHFKKLDPKITTTFDEAAQKCQLKGSQFKAELCIKPDQQKSRVAIEVEIPLALALFKGKIQDEIEKAFKKILSS